MTHIPFTISAYFFNVLSVTIDKFMLTKGVPNPATLVFYISLFSLPALLVLPFTTIPTFAAFVLASAFTLLWTGGLYFMFCALRIGQPSRIIPVIGTLVPLLLLISAVTTNALGEREVTAVILLLFGLVFLTLVDWKGRPTKQEVIFEILASLLFAASYIALRNAYLQSDFLTVFAWSKFILVPFILAVVVVPSLHRAILTPAGNQPKFSLLSKMGLLFLAGQAAGGASELLLTFSISLANPALVNSLQGTQYAFLFIFSIFLSKRFPEVIQEKLTTLTVLSKLLGIAFIAGGLYLLAK